MLDVAFLGCFIPIVCPLRQAGKVSLSVDSLEILWLYLFVVVPLTLRVYIFVINLVEIILPIGIYLRCLHERLGFSLVYLNRALIIARAAPHFERVPLVNVFE